MYATPCGCGCRGGGGREKYTVSDELHISEVFLVPDNKLTLPPPPEQMFFAFSSAAAPFWAQVFTGLALGARLMTLPRHEQEPLQQSQYLVVFAMPV